MICLSSFFACLYVEKSLKMWNNVCSFREEYYET